MKAKLMRDDGARVHVVVFETGDEFLGELTAYAEERKLAAAHFSGIGAFLEAKLAWFDCETKEYVPIYVDEQVEVASLTGNVSRFAGTIRVHAHAVLGREDGSTVAGHVLSGTVRPTLELVLVEEPGELSRALDPESGLPLLTAE